MKLHKKITISIPLELDKVLDMLVKASKDTPKPVTKSSVFVVACYDYLNEAYKELLKISKEDN